MYHLRKLKSMLLLLLVAVSARAQIEHGKVYNFVNIANTGKSMVWVSGDQLSIAKTDKRDNKQLWYVVKNEDASYSLRNLDNGKYLRSPNATGNARWTTVENVDDNCKFECVVAGSGYSLRATNSESDQHYMHYSEPTNGVDRIVCWSTTEPSQWTINKMDISEKELDYMFASEYKDAYQNILSTLFTDYSCSELKSQYASYSESQMQADANYQRLSATLQKMVLKVLSGNWYEANYDGNKSAWDSEYAKKYRVQLYEPYNEPEAAAKAIGINAHTNMNNPTGIFSGAHEVLYIMVEGTIKEGASLYLASITGHNRLEGYDEGILLNEGLNIIPTEAAGNNYFINYVVHTFDTSNGKRGKAAKARILSDFPDLKIHIEGGYINGYWNKMGDDLYTADTNDSWNYIEQRATQTDVTVLGEYMTLQFPLRDEDTEQYIVKDEDGNVLKDEEGNDLKAWNKGLGSYLNELVKIEDVINSWDNVMMWERFLLGLLSEETTLDVAKNPQSPYSSQRNVVGYIGDETDGGYADYYNVHGLALGVGGNSYMYGSWNHSGYHFNTMESIIRDIPNNVGSHWGPAHEIGHQHQSLITMRGETEVSNNLFSNVVLWYFGKTTSRVNAADGSLENVLKNFNKEDGNYLTNNIWGMTHMYYKLFLYYHVLGHNPKFYPRLFEILRQDPIEGMGGTVDGAKAQLHLYKMVCRAAEEDLTEFFRAHGFFTPLDGFLMGDYGESTYYMTQEQIDAAIAEVKAHNWNENIAVLFINDATPDGAITSHKGGQLSLYDRDGDDLDQDGDKDEPYPFPLAEMGGYATFKKSVTDGAELQYTVSGKNVTVNAGGGVGYAIYDKEGELIAFSNKKTFTVSDECATALMWGNATMKVVNADNTTVEVEVDDAVASKHELLGNLIAEVEAELQYDDPTRVGYYIAGALDNLRTICKDAKRVYDNQDVISYAAAYTKLSEEFYAVTHDAYNHVTMMAGTYRLNSRSNTDYWMSVNADNKAIGESSNTSSTKQQEWVFEATGAEGIFYIKNANTSRYLTTAVKNTQMVTTDNKAEAKGYKVDLVETGVMTLQCQDGDKQFLNLNGSTVLGWGASNDHNSQWYITTVSVEQTAGKLHELNTLVNKTKELIDKMAEVTPTQKQTLLQTTSPSSPFYLSTNACHNTLNNASDGQGLAGLLDEDVATYFHSDYWNKVTDTHYLQVDMGASNLSDLAFYYTTRDNGDNCPTTIEVWGSTDGTNFNTLLYTFTGLPTESGQTWESPMLSKADGYRSLRFMVTAAEGGNRFFVMSRFGFAKCEATVESKGEEYVAKGLTDDALISAYASIHKAQEKIMVGGATLDELTSLYDELSPKYAALEVIYNKAKNFAFNTRMAELKDWKERLSLLIDQCGTVTFNYDGELVLQTSNPNGNCYVSTNADNNHSYGGTTYKDGDGIAALVDNNTNTYFHTRWQGEPVGEAHYIQVDMGEGVTIGDFMFSYTARDNSPAPTEMTIYGSNNVAEFKDVITTVNKDWADNNRDGVYTSDRIASPKAYRYLRFTVTASNGPGNETFHNQYFFGMKEMDITAYGRSEKYTVTLGNEAGDVTRELMIATYEAVQEAQSVVDYANTESQVQMAIEKLQAQYQALEDAKNSVVYVEYTISTNVAGGGVIYKEQPNTTRLTAPNTLTESDLIAIKIEGYHPNPEVTVNHETGVISVTYTLDKSALGDLLDKTQVLIDECGGFVNSEFVTEDFDALLREANTARAIAQEAYETVQTPNELSDALNALKTAHDKLYTAKESAKTEMQNQLSSLIRTTESLIYNCYEAETFLYEGSLNVTEALIAKTNEVLRTASGTYNNSEFNAEDYESALHDLTIAKQNLATAIAYDTLPVQLTFDASSPVTYKIKIARANTPVLAYDASSAMVAVTTFELDNKSHAWYFMATTDGKVLIMPYHDRNTTLALSTNEFAEGNSKVKGMPIGEEGYTQEWTITNANMNEANRNAGWYNITTINPTNTNKTWYFSNHGGTGNKMGFYNNADDDGSRFQFEKVDFSKSDAYYTLSNYYHNEAKVSGTVTGGTVVGCYPEAAADAYNTAYSNAANVLENATATDEEYTNAYHALKAANEALNLIMPEVGKYYTIVSACNDNRGGQLMYATGENGMKFSGEKTAQSPEALWTFTEEGYMMNLQTGCYVGTSDWGKALILVENGAKVVSFESLLTSDGQVMLKPGNSYPLHAQVSGSTIVGYKNDNNASAWRIVEVEDMSLVNFTLSMSQYKHAGLYLNYAVEIPDNVDAYYIAGDEIAINAEGVGTLKLTKIENGVIPARTGVILNAPEGNYAFNYVDSDATIEGNLLTGSTYLQYRAAEEGHSYYNFGQKDRVVGLYKNSVKYDAAGAEGTTHYKMSANKVLFDWDASSQGVTSFRFSIGEETGIEGITIDADATIYDLYGRRVLEVVTPGLYIINGEKRYIQVK